MVLQAIGCSGASVPSLEVFLRKRSHLSDKSFDVLSTRMAKTVKPVLAQLKTLMLTVHNDRYFDHGSTLGPSRYVTLQKYL